LKVVKKASYLFFALVLTACGGGSGGGSSFSALGASSTGSAKDGAVSETADATSAVKAVATAQKLDSTWTRVAGEGQTVSLAAGTVVQFGANDSFVQKTVSGSMTCTNNFFGSDPLPGVEKACYTQGGGTWHGLIDCLDRVLPQLPEDTRIIAGHGALSDMKALRAYLAMLKETTRIVEEHLDRGESAEDMIRGHVLTAFDPLGKGGAQTTDQYIVMLTGLLARAPDQAMQKEKSAGASASIAHWPGR